MSPSKLLTLFIGDPMSTRQGKDEARNSSFLLFESNFVLELIFHNFTLQKVQLWTMVVYFYSKGSLLDAWMNISSKIHERSSNFIYSWKHSIYVWIVLPLLEDNGKIVSNKFSRYGLLLNVSESASLKYNHIYSIRKYFVFTVVWFQFCLKEIRFRCSFPNETACYI